MAVSYTHLEHATETGILGGEAVLDSIGVNEVLKIVAQRERPTVDNARGKFFQTSVGFNSSFPSNHAIIAWSSAAVIASEYKGPLTQITAYGLATGVSLTRILARQHFPSDVLVGSAVGWLIGRYVVDVYKRQLCIRTSLRLPLLGHTSCKSARSGWRSLCWDLGT